MFRFDNRILYIFILIFIVSSVVQNLSQENFLLNLVLTLPAVLIAITFHEYAHAWAADKLGDDTPRRQGRLSLNPLAHLDPIGCVLLVFAGFGWGKPVEVNPRNYNRDISMTKADALVSFAGPAMNFILAFIFMILYYAIVTFAPVFCMQTMGQVILTLITITISINIGLGVFNLIPLPPLDGSKILNHFLSYQARNWMAQHEFYFYIGFLLLWVTNLASYIVTPVVQLIFHGMNALVGGIFHLF